MKKEDDSKQKPDRANVVAGILLALVLIGLPIATFAYQNNIRPAQLEQDNVVEVFAHKEEAGGWSLDRIELRRNETYTLRFLAIDVTHGFAAEEFDINVKFIPGHPKEVTITPQRSGTFEFECTVYCSEFHSVMKGTIVVT